MVLNSELPIFDSSFKPNETMTTLSVTLPNPKKSGNLLHFTIEFQISNFDKVIDMISKITTVDELKNSVAWKII